MPESTATNAVCYTTSRDAIQPTKQQHYFNVVTWMQEI